MSAAGAWEIAFKIIVDELNGGADGKLIDLSEMRFGDIGRKAPPVECAAGATLCRLLAAQRGAVIIADVPCELHEASLGWKLSGSNILLLPRSVQVKA